MNPIVINHFSRRRELIEMLKERGIKKGAEIGVDHGKYAEQLLRGIPGLQLLCIDPWLPYTEGTEVHDQENISAIYHEAHERLTPLNANVLRATSMEAVQYIDNNSLDFIFIDGNHSYSYVLEDITEWYKKLKPGGIMVGHDYKEDKVNDYGVIEAVQKYTTDNHITPWFVLHAGGSLVDCWMFIKQ